jgi:hypothetical protein
MEPTEMGQIEGASPCLQTPPTKSIWFIKPIKHKPQKDLTFPHLQSPHIWSLTAIYMHCFMNNIVKNKVLSDPKSYLGDKINELTKNSKNKNIRDLYRGINEIREAN